MKDLTWPALEPAIQLAVYEKNITGIKYVIFRLNSTREIIVSFRGTVNVKNWILNLILTDKPKYTKPGPLFHYGFKVAYESILSSLLDQLKLILELNPKFNLVFTGHSLGGAIATIAVADLLLKDTVKCQKSLYALSIPSFRVSLITFGTPRVGNENTSQLFRQLKLRSSYRVTNRNDPVPRLPPRSIGFQHVQREYWINLSGELVTCSDALSSEANDCINFLDLPNASTSAHTVNYMGLDIGTKACSLPVDQAK